MTGRQVRQLGEIVAERVRRYRDAQDLRQEDLAKRVTALGLPMNRVTIAKIENGGTRADNISLVDVLVLAAALDVPPPLLFLPLGEDDKVAITPSVHVHPHVALEWIAGEDPFTTSDRKAVNTRTWTRNAQPVFLFRLLRQLVAQVNRDDSEENVKRLAEHLTYMERADLGFELQLPAASENLRARLAAYGVDVKPLQEEEKP